MPNTIEKRALSIREAAQACGISRASVYRLIEAKKLQTVKILGRRLVRPEAIAALLSGGAER
jgi:excisionase family DNA binding protein